MLVLGGCGGKSAPVASPGQKASSTVCASQWKDVADSVIGLDQDTDPSSLASRWTSVIATVAYYRTRRQTKDCQQVVDHQVKAIADLRRFSDQLRPYDMAYQLQQVQASIDLYLHDPLPSPAKDAKGHTVRPPTKPAVLAAYETLKSEAPTAAADLQPGWAQMATVSLDDATALRTAVTDLDTLAQDSTAWQHCESALQVLVAATHAQEGLLGQPQSSPAAQP